MSVPSPPRTLARLLTLLLLALLVAAALYALFFTDFGRQLRRDHHAAGLAFRAWVDDHRVVAPMILVALYVAAGLALLPVWWLQILAGYGFGVAWGVAWALAGATLGAVIAFFASRTLLADWVRDTFEARHARLREIDEKMGHNGLLVVMAARLTHVLPFGVCNYLFGLSRITPMDVALGTLLGNAPLITFYVALGAGRNPWSDWRFMAGLAALNLLLLVPVALRYWKPEWFRKIGVE